MTIDEYFQAKVKIGEEWIPVRIMVLIEKWAMVRRADLRGAMPFVVGIEKLFEAQKKGGDPCEPSVIPHKGESER